MNTAWQRDMMKWGGFRISYIRRGIEEHIYMCVGEHVRACVRFSNALVLLL
jgi:hypothetical protein